MNIERMQRLTLDLIAIDSVTGNEKKICDFVTKELQDRGYHVRTFEVTPGRRNILAAKDSFDKLRLMFNTHLDTVPVQYGPQQDEHRIYGRGACDTHGILAAQLEALDALCVSGRDDCGILLVVGEETIHDGATHAARCPEIEAPEVLIVGEPTSNHLISSQLGRMKAELTVYGIEGHSGYPEKFDSAVEKMCRFLRMLWSEAWLKKDSEAGTTVNTILKSSGEADNKVPARAGARFMFRCHEPTREIQRKVGHLVDEFNKSEKHPKLATSHVELKWEAESSEPNHDLATLTGFATATAAFNTDIGYLGWQNTRTFLIGPGTILNAHRDLRHQDWQSGEWIDKREQIDSVELYLRIVEQSMSPQ